MRILFYAYFITEFFLQFIEFMLSEKDFKAAQKYIYIFFVSGSKNKY